MKYFRKCASIILILLLIFLFSGCNKKPLTNTSSANIKTSTKQGTTSSSDKKSATTAKSTSKGSTSAQVDVVNVDNNIDQNEELPDEEVEIENPGITEEIIDLGGRTITIKAWLDWARDKTSNGNGFSLNDAEKEIEEKYNCKFVWDTSISDITQFNNDLKIRLLAGTIEQDIVQARDDIIFPWATDGIILALEDILNTPEEWKVIDEHVSSYSQWVNGKHYGFFNDDTKQLHASTMYLYQLLEKEGIPDIRDYYMANGKWTWNEFLDIAVTTTRDFNGDGITDQWGTLSQGLGLGHMLLYSNGAKYVDTDNMSQNVEFALNSRQAINALQFLSDLFNTYKVVTQNVADFRNQKVVMWLTQPYMYNITAQTPTKNDDLVDLALLPIGVDADGYDWGQLSIVRFLSIPATTKNPKDVLLAYAAVCTKYMEAFKNDNIIYNRGVARAASAGCKREKNIDFYGLYDYARDPIYNHLRVYGNLSTIIDSQIIQKVISREVSVSTALGAAASVAQAEINKVLGN